MTGLRKPTAADVARARRLHDGGFGPVGITRMLTEDGIAVDKSTVSLWVNPASARRKAEYDAAYQARRRAQRMAARKHSDEYIAEKIRRYRQAGAGVRSIAAVLRADYGVELRESQIDTFLKRGEMPRKYAARKAVA